MPVSLFVFVAVVAQGADKAGFIITRDAYGVPTVVGTTIASTFEGSGYATAQGRLRQMEYSRRLTRGRLSKFLGKKYEASDRDILRWAYTDQELQTQFDSLTPAAKSAFTNYTKGVNQAISEANGKGGTALKPWTELDSVAIAIHLFQNFGRGGAGEIRNFALLQYLKSRPNLKGKELDVFDDLAPFYGEDIPTVIPADDPQANKPPAFLTPSRQTTEIHVKSLPEISFLELLPGLRVMNDRPSTLVAEKLGVANQWGSYAVVVGKNRSATGKPILLSAPQMGFSNPSVVHEQALVGPGFQVRGMDVPGIPGILVGHTPYMAWGLTSGIADTDDLVYYPYKGESFTSRGLGQNFQKVEFPLGDGQKVTQLRTSDGIVALLNAKSGTAFVRRSSYWRKELQSFDAVFGLYTAKSLRDMDQSLRRATMSFNFFYATNDGHTGYRYMGLVPVRGGAYDPRLPIPGDKLDWKGFLSFEKMPHVRNPKSGLLMNWNNRPAAWWPNGDTPAWGIGNRIHVLQKYLSDSILITTDKVKGVVEQLAKVDLDADLIPKLDNSFSGILGANVESGRHRRYVESLRTELFGGWLGNLGSPDNFRQITQTTLIHQALNGKTKFVYTTDGLKTATAAFEAIKNNSAPYVPSRAVFGEGIGFDWRERGTFIQVVDFSAGFPLSVSVLPPGTTESGLHATDQVSLAQNFQFKPARLPQLRLNP